MRRLLHNPKYLSVEQLVRVVCGHSEDSRRVLLEACDKAAWIDPDKVPQAWDEAWHVWPLAVAEVNELYDDEVSELYITCCGRDIGRFMLMLRALDLGILPGKEVKGRRCPLNWHLLWEKVLEKAPRFGSARNEKYDPAKAEGKLL